MLEAEGIEFEYRDYIKDPLDAAELNDVIDKIDVPFKKLLRKNDKHYKALGLTGEESREVLIGHIAEFPSIMNRPIGIAGGKVVYGRPIENLLALK